MYEFSTACCCVFVLWLAAYLIVKKNCARLVGEFLDREISATVEEDTRVVDDLVDFITGGETDKNKRRKKRENAATWHSGRKNRKTENIGVDETINAIKNKNKDDFRIDDTVMNVDIQKHTEKSIHKEVPENLPNRNYSITGEPEKNKKKKKGKIVGSLLDRAHCNNRKAGNIAVKENTNATKTGNKDDSGIDDTIMNVDIEKHTKIWIHKKVPENHLNTKNSIHANQNKNKKKLEEKIAGKNVQLDEHEKKVKDMIDTKSIKIKNLDSKIERSHEEENLKLSQVDNLDKELSNLEMEMTELKQKKAKLLEGSKNNKKQRKEFEQKKQKLEEDFENELQISKQKGNIIKDEILELESRLQHTKKLIQNLPNEKKTYHEPKIELL